MTFTKISVLVPTRGRVANLEQLIASFEATTDGLAELVFRCDNDDPETMAVLARTTYRFQAGPRLQGYRSLPTFFEELRAIASGDLLMCGNDDMRFLTEGWPALVLSTANRYPDGRFVIAVNTHNAGNVPFSIVSADAIRTIGHLHDPNVYWGDLYLRDIFAAFGRVIPLPDVRVAHTWMGWTPDQTFREARQDEFGAWTTVYHDTHTAAVSNAVEKLKASACLG